MSGYLAGRVWQSGLEPHLKPLAAALADIANDNGDNVYPSIPYVCWLMGLGERTVRRHLAELRALVVLEIVGEVRDLQKLGRGYGAEYRLREDMLPERPAWRGPKAAKADRESHATVADLSKKGMPSTPESSATCGSEGLPLAASSLLADPSEDPSGTKSADPLSPERVFEIWNEEAKAPVPKLRRLSPERRARLLRLVKKHPAAADWVLMLRWLNAQPWCTGRTDRKFVMSIDMLFREGGARVERYLEQATSAPAAGPRNRGELRESIRQDLVSNVSEPMWTPPIDDEEVSADADHH